MRRLRLDKHSSMQHHGLLRIPSQLLDTHIERVSAAGQTAQAILYARGGFCGASGKQAKPDISILDVNGQMNAFLGYSRVDGTAYQQLQRLRYSGQ